MNHVILCKIYIHIPGFIYSKINCHSYTLFWNMVCLDYIRIPLYITITNQIRSISRFRFYQKKLNRITYTFKNAIYRIPKMPSTIITRQNNRYWLYFVFCTICCSTHLYVDFNPFSNVIFGSQLYNPLNNELSEFLDSTPIGPAI